MKHVRLTIRAPEGVVHPVFDMLTRSAHVEHVTGLHWSFAGDRLGILHYVEGNSDAYVAELESIASVLEYELVPADEDSFYVYHRCTVQDEGRTLWETLTGRTVLLVPPAEFGCDGSVTVSMYGPSDEIQATIDAVSASIEVEIHEIGSMAGTPGLAGTMLTDRQREAAETALSLGYYEIPREASHEDVAEAIDCAPSTAAEHLRKAEATVMQATLDG